MRSFIYNLIQDGNKPGLISALPTFFESESKPYWYLPYIGGRAITEPTIDEMMALRPRVHSAIANSVHSGSIFTKTHNQLCNYNGLPLHNMAVTAAAIYIVRNPLDVVISMADHFGMSLDDAIRFMGDNRTIAPSTIEDVAGFLGSWSNHVESWSRDLNDQFIVLRYEDMITKPLRTFSRVAKLLNLNQDKQRIKRAIEFSSFSELKKQEMASGFIERSPESKAFFRKGKKNQWVNELDDAQITRIIDAHKRQMSRFDYVPPRYKKRKATT